MSELQINAKDLLEGKLFQLNFSKDLFPEKEVVLKQDDPHGDEDFLMGIFSNPSVIELLLKKNSLKIRLDGQTDWKAVAKFVANLVRVNEDSLLSDEFYKKFEDYKNISSNNIALEAQEIIDKYIAPSLGAHGGAVSVKGYEDGKLFLEFSGGCQGCSQVSATLRDGIEQIFKTKRPEIVQIIDVTDHKDGDNPFYK